MDKNTALQAACNMCDTIMRKFPDAILPPEASFHYHAGVFLSGMLRCYLLTGNEKYFNYIKAWADSNIDENGEIPSQNKEHLDDLQAGNLLFLLYDKTKDIRYRKALDSLPPLLKSWRKNAEGGFWHKDFRVNQMWLDGLYMAGPLAVRYGAQTGDDEYLSIMCKQAMLMKKHMKDEKTGLYYHAWDEDKAEDWANPVTGTAPEFWGRADGWYCTALLDMLDFIPETNPVYQKFAATAADLLRALVRVQDPEDGRWFQVLDKGGCKGNWHENSCSCLFVYCLLKAISKNILSKEYLRYAEKGFDAVLRSLKYSGDDIILDDICQGTSVGNYEYYCNRPRGQNDLHGAGAFILMCTQAAITLDAKS